MQDEELDNNEELDKNEYLVDLRVIAELLIKHHNIHSGFYKANMEFELRVGPIGTKNTGGNSVLPGVMARVRRVGLTALSATHEDAVDASKVNPVKRPKAQKK
jgi:hypothetical protein